MNFVTSKELENILELRYSNDSNNASGMILEQKFSPKDINVEPYKVINWRKEGIKLTGYKLEKDKRKKYNLVEIVWMQMLQTMKELKIHSNHIKELSENVWSNVFDNSEVLMNHPVFKEIFKDVSEEKLEQVKLAMGDLYCPFIELFILDIILIKSHYSIVIDKDGNSLPCKESHLAMNTKEILQLKDMMRRSHISISINEAISKFLFEFPEPDEIAARLELISPQEYEAIKKVREQGVKAVNLRFDNKGKLDLIETSKVINPKKIKDSNELNRLLYSESFRDIEIKTQNEEVIYILEKTKQKV